MDKIVVQYSIDGGYECGSFLAVECLEYESIEAFYVHFEEKVKQYIDAEKAAKASFDVWQPTYQNICKRIRDNDRQKPTAKREAKGEELQQEFRKNYQLRPNWPLQEQSFKFNEIEFDAKNFVYDERQNKELILDMPIIMKLEEWFQAKTEGKI